MTKAEFLVKLKASLSDLPDDEIAERIAFYSEMIDDRIEEGLSEEEAVSAVADKDEIISQIKIETPKKKKKISAWVAVLLVLGSPLWLSLILAAFSVVLSLYIVLWSVIISLWSVFASLVGCAFGGIFGGAVLAFGGGALVGTAVIGAGLVCAGLAIFFFFICMAATKGAALLTKTIFTKRRAK